MRSLAVLVDGTPMPDAEARALWERFSAWMEEHKGDLGGFAAREGFASVHPAVRNGQPVLLASRTDIQKPYGPATDHGSDSRGGGSHKRHSTRRGRPAPHDSPRKKPH
jgi:hypothetical protein